MALKKSELYSSLWSGCDELRGGMDASQYKDYVLVLLFIKYVSDKYAGVLPLSPSRRVRASRISVLHQLDPKIIYPHYDFKHLTEKYFEIGMKLDDFRIQLVKYWIWLHSKANRISAIR